MSLLEITRLEIDNIVCWQSNGIILGQIDLLCEL